ncbi:MAG: hypothetical protein CMM47_09230 [Rhodospirillaceae bacterium]|nr:hypothetical protein [Rhodospirillaceae bacterium]
MRVGLSLFLGIACFANMSCGSVPQPFRPPEDSKNHNEFLLAPNSGGVVVERIQGPVGWVGEALSEAMAKSLRTRGIVASSKWANRRSKRLVASGFQQLHKDRVPELVMKWSLLDQEGIAIERREIRTSPSPSFWSAPTPGMFHDVAETNVRVVSAWIQPNRTIVKPIVLPSILIADVVGAPGDGSQSLARAIRLSLVAERIPLDINAAEYLTVIPQISVTNAGALEDNVRITWLVRTSDGVTIGHVTQENKVTRGQLDGRWGSVAIAIADGAANGIADLVRTFANRKTSSLP